MMASISPRLTRCHTRFLGRTRTQISDNATAPMSARGDIFPSTPGEAGAAAVIEYRCEPAASPMSVSMRRRHRAPLLRAMSGHFEAEDDADMSERDVYEVWLKRLGCEQLSLRRRPFLRPFLTWTASISPRLTRCHTVCRETPSRRMT
jgi:hypothetical protein